MEDQTLNQGGVNGSLENEDKEKETEDGVDNEEEEIDENADDAVDEEDERVGKPIRLSSVRYSITKLQEQLMEREKRRLKMSKCCLNEIWSVYSKLIDPLDANKHLSLINELEGTEEEPNSEKTEESTSEEQEEPELDGTDEQNLDVKKEQNVISSTSEDELSSSEADVGGSKKYSSEQSSIQYGTSRYSAKHNSVGERDQELRIERLKEKHALFKMALDTLKEAACPPFLRIEKPQFLDKTGGRQHLLEITRNQKPEIDHEDIHPITMAAPFKHTNVANKNFLIYPIKHVEVWTQTVESQSVVIVFSDGKFNSKSGVNIRDSPSKEKRPIGLDSEEKFDYTDIPLDQDGNPIGKRTGNCHYCAKEILPLPTPYLMSRGYDPDQFYCCKEYKEMHLEIEALEKKLRKEEEKKNFFIDIASSEGFDAKKSKFPGFSVVKPPSILPGIGSINPQWSTIAISKKQKGKDKKDHKDPKTQSELTPGSLSEEAAKKKQEKKKAGGPGAGIRKGRFGAKKRLSEDKGEKSRDQFTSTEDLEWDPYEVVYGHPRWFKEGEHYKPLHDCYNHVEVVLTQAELYDMIVTAPLSEHVSSYSSGSRSSFTTTGSSAS